MKRIAFRMKLFKGYETEYRRRHEQIWPELVQLLKGNGIEDYSIFLDADTNVLFAVLKISNEGNLDILPNHPVMQRWWAYMKDIMECNEDHSPVAIPLNEVFHLP